MNVGPEIADILVIESNPVVARRAARVLSRRRRWRRLR
jgi:hypothetical protein